MTRQPKPSTPVRKTDRASVCPNQALFKKMQAAADVRKLDVPIDEKWGQVQQSVQQWESSRKTLVEIQDLLVQAYRELELMKTEN